MVPDRSLVGTTGEPFELPVERGKIRELALATFSRHEAYLGDAPIMPATFLTTQFSWEPEATSPWRLVRPVEGGGLHAEQEFVFHGPPPPAGTTLTGTSSIEDVFEKQNRRGATLTFAVMVTTFHDADGRLVAESRTTVVHTAGGAS